MKIVQIITLSEPIGGAQMVLYNNCEAMVKAGHEVHVLVGQLGTLTDRLKELNVFVTEISSLQREISLGTDMKCYRELRDKIKQLNPDIVISHSSKAGILSRLACYKTGTRNIFTAHGWSFTPGVKGVKRYVFMVLEKIMGRFTDHVITVSEFDRKQALKYAIVPDHKMRVVYNGSPDLTSKQPIDKQEDVLRVLMVARFQYPKDHLTLFKALEILKSEKIMVDLVGSGEFIDSFKELSKEMAIDHMLEFHGESNEVPSFLNRADVFVLTSKFEALPLSICEAMSVGIPILASDVGGIHEMIVNDGNGYLIQKEDHLDLAQKLDNLIHDKELLKRLGLNARKTFEDKFSIELMANATKVYIEDILKTGSE